MSKLSPFRRNPTIYLQDYSPATTHNENKNFDKAKNRRTNPVQQTNKRYYNAEDSYPKLTEKKRYDQMTNIDIDSLLQKNKALANENTQLYIMLEERGKIIVALEKKLEDQVRAELMTLEAIELEKGRFIGESHRKFKDYERKIQQLINEIYLLNQEREKGKFVNAKEMQMLKQTLNQEQLAHFQSIAQNQANARQISQFERMKMKGLLENKNNQIEMLALQHQTAVDKLKNEIISLSNQILHLNHLRKIEVSQQKILYQNTLDNLAKDQNKQKQLLILTHNIQVKKLNNLVASLETELSKISEHRKIGEIEQNNRELELIENNTKLESQMQSIEEFHKKSAFEQTQRLKYLNKNQIEALQTSTQAIVNNLKGENAILINIVNAKSQQIDRLLNEQNNLRNQHSLDASKAQNLTEELKEKMRQMQRNFMEESQNMKVKYAQLREADLHGLKQFYQHQIDVLNKDLFEKNNLASKNRALLHEQLHYKNEMRKNFDIEILKLTSRIRQLQLRLDEKFTQKREEMKSVNEKMQMTSDILLRESKDKQRLNQINEEEKKNLQQLIRMKDKQIQQLNLKISLLNKNHIIEVSQKKAQIELLKKDKDDVQMQLKKEKYFYDNELKKKDILLKSNKELYNNDLQRLKHYHRQQLENHIKQSSTKIHLLEVQLNKYRAIEKNLKNQLNNLSQAKQIQVKSKSNHLELQKQRLTNERKDSLEKLELYYQAEIAKLNTQIADLKQQLLYKEEDIRTNAEKYQRLEKKLERVIESQQKLKNMQNRIVAMGQDNNLVKNIAEIIRTRSS